MSYDESKRMKSTQCQNCSKEFSFNPWKSKGKYCGYPCYWASKKKNSTLHLHFGLYATKGHDLVWNKGIAIDRLIHPNMGAWKKNRTKDISGKNHFAWKGEKVSYTGLHNWVRRNLGIASVCEYCRFSSQNHRQFHWANISHEYKRELSDWIRLCIKCHKKYDAGKIALKNTL